MEKERPKIGVGVVVRKDNLVLLGKRKNSHGSGEWAFPGGHLELGETPEECAKRELLEETNLTAVSVEAGAWTNDVMEETKHYVTLFMVVDDFAGDLQVMEPQKCEGWEWFEWDKLPEPLFVPIQSLVKKVGLYSLQYPCCDYNF